MFPFHWPKRRRYGSKLAQKLSKFTMNVCQKDIFIIFFFVSLTIPAAAWVSTCPDCLLLYCFPSEPDSTEYLCRVPLWFLRNECFLLLSAAGVCPSGSLVCSLAVNIVISFINGHLFSVNSISAADWAEQQGGDRGSINTHTHTRDPLMLNVCSCMWKSLPNTMMLLCLTVSHYFCLERERGSWEWVMSASRQTLWSDSKIKTHFISLDIPWLIIESLQICISVLAVPMLFDAVLSNIESGFFFVQKRCVKCTFALEKDVHAHIRVLK